MNRFLFLRWPISKKKRFKILLRVALSIRALKLYSTVRDAKFMAVSAVIKLTLIMKMEM